MIIQFKQLGRVPYLDTWREMQTFTDLRDDKTPDEIWFLEHDPVFTQGQAGKAEHVLNPGEIPVVQTDRGGQVTYHGPGQLVAYFLINIRRRQLGVRNLVTLIEQAVIDVLSRYHINAAARADAPGVYINGAKIASIGLRVRRGCSYHGLSFNINMDIQPFLRINPCGMQNLPITQLSHFIPGISQAEVAVKLQEAIIRQLTNYSVQNLQPNLASNEDLT